MATTAFDVHARTIAGSLFGITRELVVEIHRETHDLADGTAVAVSPVAKGTLKAAWTSTPSGIQTAIEAMQPTKVRNAAPHALIIDRGRRRSGNTWNVRRGGKTHTVKAGKMLGSMQAPQGMKGQVLREISAQQDAIFQRAAAAVERKGER